MGRYGPMVQIGSPDDPEKPRYAKIRGNFSIETITLADALPLFALPRTIGQHEGTDVVVSEGRFGPYVLHDKKFHSLKKDQDPMTITLDEALVLISEKQSNVIKEFKESGVSVLNGKWGPYVKSGKLNAKIPKDSDPAKLTLEECMELLEKAKEAPKRGFNRFRKRGT